MAAEVFTESRCNSYNGVVLPNEPDYDTGTYSYPLILYGTNTATGEEQYIWLACTQPFLKYSDGVYAYPADADIIGFAAWKSSCKWSEGTITKEEGEADFYKFSGDFVWTFLPIYEYSDQTVVAHEAGTLEDYDAEQPTITALTGAGTADSPTGYWQGDVSTALSCEAEVSDGGSLYYKWYRNGTYVGSGRNHIPSTATVGQFGYQCVVTNTLTGESGFSDVDTVTSDTMWVVVTAVETDDDTEGDTEDTAEQEAIAKRTKQHIIGYVLKMCGVPCAEAIAMMIAENYAPSYIFEEKSGTLTIYKDDGSLSYSFPAEEPNMMTFHLDVSEV